jgi:hypothetical protein
MLQAGKDFGYPHYWQIRAIGADYAYTLHTTLPLNFEHALQSLAQISVTLSAQLNIGKMVAKIAALPAITDHNFNIQSLYALNAISLTKSIESCGLHRG